MKNKLVEKGIKVLIVLTGAFLILIVAVGTKIILENSEYPQRRHQVSEFYSAYNEKRYYDMYVMAVENAVKNGVIYEDTSQFEAFGECFNALMMYQSDNDQKYLDTYDQNYADISWEFLKTKLNEIRNKLLSN